MNYIRKILDEVEYTRRALIEDIPSYAKDKKVWVEAVDEVTNYGEKTSTMNAVFAAYKAKQVGDSVVLIRDSYFRINDARSLSDAEMDILKNFVESLLKSHSCAGYTLATNNNEGRVYINSTDGKTNYAHVGVTTQGNLEVTKMTTCPIDIQKAMDDLIKNGINVAYDSQGNVKEHFKGVIEASKSLIKKAADVISSVAKDPVKDLKNEALSVFGPVGVIANELAKSISSKRKDSFFDTSDMSFDDKLFFYMTSNVSKDILIVKDGNLYKFYYNDSPLIATYNNDTGEVSTYDDSFVKSKDIIDALNVLSKDKSVLENKSEVDHLFDSDIDKDNLRNEIISLIAEEYIAWYQYRQMVDVVASESQLPVYIFKEIAADELDDHVSKLQDVLKSQLGGGVILSPEQWNQCAKNKYCIPESTHIQDIISLNIKAELGAIEHYYEVMHMEGAPCDVLREIIADEVEHLQNLHDFSIMVGDFFSRVSTAYFDEGVNLSYAPGMLYDEDELLEKGECLSSFSDWSKAVAITTDCGNKQATFESTGFIYDKLRNSSY